MIRTRSSSAIAVSVLALAFLGCNAILDNQPGALFDEAGASPGSIVSADAATDAPALPGPEDAGAKANADADADAGATPGAPCPAGQQACFGACVSMTDPLYGCGNPSCTSCPSTHSTMGCMGRSCVVAACDPGYADCNAKSADGCEVDLSKSVTCGACNATCGPASPLCAPAGASFQCTNGCLPIAPLACGAECVDPQTSPIDCGGCNIKCPIVANATIACNGGACAFTCKPSFHACTGKCVARTDPATCGADCAPCAAPIGGTATCVNDTCGKLCEGPSHLCGAKCVSVGVADNDPMACGAGCLVCPAAANAAPSCTAGACGLACALGFGNCDANPANGCEATFATDPLNCGHCGKSCGAQLCVAGLCVVPVVVPVVP
jgi:hypothetical protein